MCPARGHMDDGSDGGTSVLFVEHSVSGHRLFYVRLLAEEAIRRGWKPTLALPEELLEAREVRLHLESLGDSIRLMSSNGSNLNETERLSRQVNAAITVVADGDWLVWPLVTRLKWNGHGTLSVLVMREKAQVGLTKAHRSLKTMVKFLLFSKAVRTKHVRLSILKSAAWRGDSRFPVAIDPVRIQASPEDGESIAREWGLDRSRKWFAVLGAVSSRKNVPVIAEALIRAKRHDIGLVIAGEIDPVAQHEIKEALEMIEQAHIPYVLIDRLLDDKELDAAVHAVDCLVIAHSNEGPSGLLGKAAFAGTRVVAAGAKSLRDDLATMPTLGQWSELDPGSLAAAITASIDSAPPAMCTDDGEAQFVLAILGPRADARTDWPPNVGTPAP